MIETVDLMELRFDGQGPTSGHPDGNPRSVGGRDMIVDMTEENLNDPEIIIEPLESLLTEEVEDRLRRELEVCPDVAFAYLCRVFVVGQSPSPEPSLFVWLAPEAVGSLRAALNLVSEAVARALPGDVFLDVLILNSVPEILIRVEESNCLFLERDVEERRRALEAATSTHGPEDPAAARPHRIWPW